MASARLLVVGNPTRFHVGAHFVRAAQMLTIPVTLCDTTRAYGGSRWTQRVFWYLLGRRPIHLEAFGRMVLRSCQLFRPTHLLATGIAPLSATTLQAIGRLGIQRLNFLTDDPWNPHHYAAWFMAALPHYDTIYSPRHANLEDLKQAGCHHVQYMPFAYDPTLHYKPATIDCPAPTKNIVFVGGADPDRIPFVTALIEAGFRPLLYGGYWERYPETKAYAGGHATPEQLTCITHQAGVNVCLVRRRNRDGHVMRSLESAACGGTLLVEDTHEHRALFGEEGDCVYYFTDSMTLTEKVRWLLNHPAESRRLADAVYARIAAGHHRYQDRLALMLPVADSL